MCLMRLGGIEDREEPGSPLDKYSRSSVSQSPLPCPWQRARLPSVALIMTLSPSNPRWLPGAKGKLSQRLKGLVI